MGRWARDSPVAKGKGGVRASREGKGAGAGAGRRVNQVSGVIELRTLRRRENRGKGEKKKM